MNPLSSCLTPVQSVQPDDVILAHLFGGAEFNVGVGDGHHGGLVVAREGVPGVRKS